MTIETKGARNGSLIVKVNGKRAKFYEAASLIGNLRNPNLEIRTDRNVTYTETCTEKCHAVYFKDSTGNLYKFDYFFSETTLRNIATGNLHNNLYKTAAELEEIEREEILSTPLVTAEAHDAATDAELEEILSTPLVTIEAQDAAIDAEIEMANADNSELDENHVDDTDTDNNRNITVNNGADAWAIIGKHFPEGVNFKCVSKGFNREDVFSYTNDEVIYVVATCTPDNSRIECIEVINTNESGSDRHVLTIYIAHDTQAKIELANKNAKKLYTINPVIDSDDDIKFNRLDILITPDGGLRIDGHFQCKNIETAYRRLVKIMTQAANDIPQLKGWDCWLPANKITADNGSFFNENGDLLFTDNDPRDTLAVDINEDTFYFFANFSPCVKPLDGFNYGMATDYQPQTNWENPHDFTITGDLSDRNINGRIAAFNHKEEVTLTDNMKLAKQITDKLGSLLVKFSHANEGNDGGLALHYETFKDEHDEFGTLTHFVEVFTDKTNFILDHVNFITGYGDDKKVEKFFFKRDDFSDFEQHLLALQKEQEDAYPEEVKALNRDLAQSNLTAPNMHLHIYNNDFHIGSFCGVELSKLHVKSFVTDKIHFNVCYASEPLEHYDTFVEVTAAVNQFKDAISRGDKEFTFPTADKLNQPVPATPAKHKHTFEVGANYFSRDFNQCAYTILKRSKKMLTVVFKGFENYDDCIVRVKIRHDENGEYFTVKEEVGVNVSCAINVYSSDFQALLIQPTRKQIVESLNRAIDKAKLNVQIARVSGNQVQANFERELYLIAAKALRELKH